MDTFKIVILLSPIVVINLLLIITCLLDWYKRKNYRYLNKVLWLFIFLFVQLIGPALYLILGRDDDRR
jgi:hypothetical protein